MELAFYASALVAIYSTLRVISTSNPMHALLNLIISLIAVAMIFFCLG
ncbi:MAG: NADH-quinone oxidoreductase subunit J, partial [Aeromonas veronii]